MIYSKIDDICEKKICTVGKKDDYLIDYIDISSIDNQKKKITSFNTMNIKEAPSRAKQILKNGDILVSTIRPNLNAVAICDIDSSNIIVGSTGYCVLRCKKEVDIRYIFYYCRSKQFIEGLINVATGASYPAVKNSDVKNSLIPIFELEMQKKISRTLDKAQKIIDKRKEQIEALDELVKSRFIEMFGDPVNNPKGWEVEELKNLCENLDKMRVPITSNSRVSGSIPYYGASGIVDYVQEYIFDETLLLVSEDGANLLARVTPIAFEIRGRTWVNNHAHVLRFKDYKLQKYIEYAINLQDVSQYITGTAQPKLNQSALNKFKVPVPPNDKLNEFLDTVKQVDKLKFEMENSLKELENNFNSLMQKAFNGEL